jgi:hypothetical protein
MPRTRLASSRDTICLFRLRWRLPSTNRSLGWPRRRRIRERANQGADARAKASEVDAPPQHAECHGNRVAVGHQGAQETAAYSHSGPAEQEADGDRAEPARADQAREGRLLGRAGGPGPFCLSRGDGRRRRTPPLQEARWVQHKGLLPEAGSGPTAGLPQAHGRSCTPEGSRPTIWFRLAPHATTTTTIPAMVLSAVSVALTVCPPGVISTTPKVAWPASPGWKV